MKFPKKTLPWGLALLFALPGAARAASGITASVSNLNFGDQAEGTASQPQTVTLTNSGGGDGVVWTITLAGQAPEQFFILEDNCSVTVQSPGSSCSLSVVYAPDAALPFGLGPAGALLQVPFNDPPAISIPLSGSSIAPDIQSDVSNFNFGSQVAGQLGDAQAFTIFNGGPADLVIQNTKIIGNNPADFGFTMDLCSFQVLGPGESCAVELSMRPTGLGDRSGLVAIESNDPDSPVFTIELAGNGTGSGGCSLRAKEPVGDFQWMLFVAVPGLFILRIYRGRQIN